MKPIEVVQDRLYEIKQRTIALLALADEKSSKDQLTLEDVQEINDIYKQISDLMDEMDHILSR